MAEPEDLTPNKRKASPEPDFEDVAGKRARLEHDDENAPPRNDAGDNAKQIDHGADAMETDQAGQHAQKSPTQPCREEPEQQPRRPSDARRPSATSGPPTRRNVSLEEKKRGQRLFGGLMSTLSRSTTGTQTQRRLEIERRQQEKAQQRRAEDEKRRAERLEQLKKTRQIEQVKLDERAVCHRPTVSEYDYVVADMWQCR
jgi:hypothetical protein